MPELPNFEALVPVSEGPNFDALVPLETPTTRPPGALPVEPAFSREIAETDVPLGSVGRGIESGGALLGRGVGGLVEHLEAGGPGGAIARKVLGEKVGGTLGRIGGYALTPLAKIVGGVSRLAGGGVDEALAGDTGRTTTEYFKQSGESIGERQAKFDPGAYSFQLSQGAVSTVPSLVAAPAGLTGMAIAAGTQVFGNTLADAADAYEKQGMTRQQAMDKAAPWALLDGLQTALLTRLVPGGESAIASVFRKEGAAAAKNFGEQVIKNYFKNSVARMGARVAKEGALEGVEEAMNQALSGAISKWSYAPEKSWEQIWEETKLGGSLGIALGGMMGGAGIVLGGREQAQPEIPPPVQPNYFQQEPLAGRMAEIERGYNPAFGQVPITPRTRNRIEQPEYQLGEVPVFGISGLVPRDTIFETPRLAPPAAPVQPAASPIAESYFRVPSQGGEMPVMPTFGETLPQPSTQPTEPDSEINSPSYNPNGRSREEQNLIFERRYKLVSDFIQSLPVGDYVVNQNGDEIIVTVERSKRTGKVSIYSKKTGSPFYLDAELNWGRVTLPSGETVFTHSTIKPYASPILSGEKVVPKARLSGQKGKGDRGSRLEQAASRQPEPVAAGTEGAAAKAPELMTPEAKATSIILRSENQQKAADAIIEMGGMVIPSQGVGRAFVVRKSDGGLWGGTISSTPKGKPSLSSGLGNIDDPSNYLQWFVDNKKASIPSEWVSDYSLTLPEGYIRSGDRYVYQPTKQPAVEPSGQTGEVSQPPPKPRMEDYKGSDNIITAFGRADDAWEESVKKWVAEQPENKAIIFQGENSTFAVTKDPKGGWRFTYFSNTDHMVTGHDEHKTREAAVIELLRMWGPMKRVAKMPFEVVPLPDRMFPGDEVIWRTKTGTEEPVNFRGFLGGSDAGKAVVVTSRGSQVTVDALDLKRKPQPKEVKTDEEKKQEGLQVNQPVEQPIQPAVESKPLPTEETAQVGDEVNWIGGDGRKARSTVTRISKLPNESEPMADVEWFGLKRVPVSKLTIVKKSAGRIAREEREANNKPAVAAPGAGSASLPPQSPTQLPPVPLSRALEIERKFGLSPADAHFFNVAIDRVSENKSKWTTLAEGVQKEAMRASIAAGWDLNKTGDLRLAKQIANEYLSEASAGGKALAVREPEMVERTERSLPPPARAEEGARKTATFAIPKSRFPSGRRTGKLPAALKKEAATPEPVKQKAEKPVEQPTTPPAEQPTGQPPLRSSVQKSGYEKTPEETNRNQRLLAKRLDESGQVLRTTQDEVNRLFSDARERNSRVLSQRKTSRLPGPTGGGNLRPGPAQGTPGVFEKTRVFIEGPASGARDGGGRSVAGEDVLASRILFGTYQATGKPDETGLFIQKLFSRLLNLKVVFRAMGEGETHALWTRDQDWGYDLIAINTTHLQRDNFNDPKVREFYDAQLIHELVHALANRVATKSEITAVWKSLSPDEQAKVQQVYRRNQLDEGGLTMDENQWGNEYIRMLFEERLFGKPSEFTDTSLSKETKNILRSAINYLKQIFGAKPTNNIAKEIIARLEGAIKGDAPIAQPVVDLTIEPPASLATNIEGAGNENFEGEKSSLSKGMEPGVAQDMESTRTGSGEILWATKGEIAQILLNPSERAGRGRGDSGTAQRTQGTPEKIRVLIEKPEASMPLSGVRQAAATLLANRIVSGLGSSEAKTETREGHFFKLLVNKLTGLKFVIREFGPLPNGQPDITPAMYQADELGRFDVVSININQIGNIAESKELQALWDSMLIEEVIHAAASRLATRPEIEQVWNKLSDEERAKVNEFYDQEKTLDKPLDAFNGGHEYIRIILQERLTGRPTELSKFSISDVTKNILRRLLAELKSLFGAKPKNEFAREVIDRIEGAIKGEPPIPQPVVGLRDYAIEETAPTWYSRITRTVEQSPQNKASGSQWKAMIRNSKLGVSKDEYALVSVDDLEDGQTYTKAEVLDYLRANEVKVEDVTLGGEKETSEITWDNLDFEDGDQYKKSKGWQSGKVHPVSAAGDFSHILIRERHEGDDTGLPFYAIESGSDYRGGEQYLTDFETLEEAKEYIKENYKPISEGVENPTHFSTYQLPGGKEGSYREVLLTVQEIKMQRDMDEGSYYKPSWRDGHSEYSDIANPIVRLRFNERTTADGKRMLFLEEVQAPQKGQFEKMPALFQKNWREIAFKWALRHAAENGFDQVGWTTGEMQAERYDLSKNISRIVLQKNPSRSGANTPEAYLSAFDLNGDRVIDKGVNADEIEGVVGKEMAAKLNAMEWKPYDPMTYTPGGITQDSKTLSGLDLKVGGEGLKKLYDVDFRNVVNGLPVVKKSGQKVGSSEAMTQKGGTTIEENPLNVGDETFEFTRGDIFNTVHSITITPEMRDAVMAGQNMFSKANQSPAGWVEVEGNQPLTEADVRAAVDPILSNWQGVTFNLVNDPNWTSGEDSLIGGMRSGNEITLNLAAIGSKERAIALLLHEGVGHLGIRGALGADFVRVMDEVWNMMTPENHAEVVKLVKRYGSDRTNLTAEWVARQAEKGATGSTWKRIWQRVMDWFAKVFGRQNAEAIARDLFRQGSKWLRTNPAERVDGKADYSIEEAARAVETGGQANVPFARRQAGAELVAAPFVRERLAEVTRIANDPNADQAQADSAKALLKNKTARKLLFGPAQKLEELEGNMGATVQTYEQSRQNPNLQPTEFQTVTLAALNSYNDFQKGVAEFLAGIEQQREAIIEMIGKGRKKLGDIFTPGTKEYQKFVNRQSANQITDILEDGVNHAATAVARETTRRVVQHKVAVQNAVVWILNNVPDWRTFTNPAELLAHVKETAGADWMQTVGANAENTADAAFMLLTFAKQFEAVMATREAAMNITTAEAEQHQLEMEAVKADLLSGNVNQAIRRYRRAIEKMAAKSSKAAEAIKMLRRKEDNLINELEGLNRMQELVTAIRQDPAYRTLGEHLAEDTRLLAPIDIFDEANDTIRLTAFPGQPEVVLQLGPSKEAAHKAFEAVNAYSQNALRYLANKDSNPDYDPFLGRSLAFFLENRAEILKSRGLLPENPGLLPSFALQLFKHGADFVFNSSTIPYFIKFFGRGLGFDRLSETIEAGSKIQKLAQRVYELMYPRSDELLYKARTAHGIPTIGEYWEKVFNRLAYSRQYHQLKALKVGDPIGNGYRVTQADLDVLNDQVAFHQGLAAAIRSQSGVAGAVSQAIPQARGIKEESPNLHFYFRDALATGPQTLSRNFGRVFRWLEQMDAGRNLEQFVNQHADTLLFGYINWANEATNLNTRYKYAAELKDIQRESLADNEPVQSVDELAQLIYDAKVKEAEDAEEEIEIPTKDEIKRTILGEIDTMLRRVRDYREALRQELTDPGEQKFALTSGVSSLTKARGDMIMPGEWYDYGTLGKDTMLAQVSNASKPSFIEMAKLLNAMVRKLQAKVDELERSGLTEQQLRERRKAGEDFMSADEAREALSQLKKIQTWLGKIEANHGNIETRSFGGIGRMDNNWRVVMRLATAAALTKGASMITNLFGGGFMTAFLRTNLDIPSQSIADFADGSIVTSSAWGSFRSIPASYAALRDLVKTTAERTTLTMTEMLAYMTGKAATKSQIKAIQKMNEYVTASLLEQRRQWQLFQEIGLDSNIQLRERFLNYLRLFETGGESIDTIKELGPARAKPKGLLARLARHPAQAFKAGALAASEGMGQLGVSWVDSVINKFAGGRIAADYELLMQALAHQTMPAKVQAAEQGGYDWRDTSLQENFWTPSEIAHNKGVDAEKVGLGRRDLVRQTGATWEQLMTDYWSRYTDWVQGGKQGTPPRFLKNDAQRNGLMVAIANRTNYSDFSNRPMSSHAGGMQEFAGYLYGWPMWAAQEMAAAFGAPSNRTTKQLRPDITSLSTMTQLMSLAIPLAILSMMAMTLRDYYSDLYKKYKIKALSPRYLAEKALAGEPIDPVVAAKITASSMANFIPFFGAVMNNWLDNASRNGYDLNSQIFGLNLANDMYNTIREVGETGDPIYSLLRFGSRWLLPDTAVRALPSVLPIEATRTLEGALGNRTANNIAAQAASLADIENRRNLTGQSTFRYTEATPMIRGWMAAMATGDDASRADFFNRLVEQKRADIIAKHPEIEPGQADTDARAAALSSLRSRHPFVTALGRMPTEQEYNTMMGKLTPENREKLTAYMAGYDRAIQQDSGGTATVRSFTTPAGGSVTTFRAPAGGGGTGLGASGGGGRLPSGGGGGQTLSSAGVGAGITRISGAPTITRAGLPRLGRFNVARRVAAAPRTRLPRLRLTRLKLPKLSARLKRPRLPRSGGRLLAMKKPRLRRTTLA